MSPVALAELDPVTRARVLEQIPEAAMTVQQESCETLGDPASLTSDQLADIVIQGVKKIRAYLPYIRTLKERFDSGDRDSTNRLRVPIKGCWSWTEFCEKHLNRTTRAVQYLLAGQSNPVDRPHRTVSEISSPTPAAAPVDPNANRVPALR